MNMRRKLGKEIVAVRDDHEIHQTDYREIEGSRQDVVLIQEVNVRGQEVGKEGDLTLEEQREK